MSDDCAWKAFQSTWATSWILLAKYACYSPALFSWLTFLICISCLFSWIYNVDHVSACLLTCHAFACMVFFHHISLHFLLFEFDLCDYSFSLFLMIRPCRVCWFFADFLLWNLFSIFLRGSSSVFRCPLRLSLFAWSMLSLRLGCFLPNFYWAFSSLVPGWLFFLAAHICFGCLIMSWTV